MMEAHPYEAVRLNIIATQFLADLAIQYKSKKFVFISTDKAVNPIGVMGVTKHIAESYLKNLNYKNNDTSFFITRFGNILGSNGSVVPLFIKQIEAGKSLSITNKEVTRYFITKSKASKLILQIATFSEYKGGIFTFNMGQPIKIIDLAKVMISKLGSKYQNDIKIAVSQLRLCEKLHEDIMSNNEILKPTEINDIYLIANKNNTKLNHFNYDTLKNITPYKSPLEIKSILETYIFP